MASAGCGEPGRATVSPVVVAGGGPAGATAAALLARAGRPVLVLERATGPTEKVCGEFLSGEAAGVLAAAGFDLATLGGHPIGAVRLIRGDRCVTAALPFAAVGVSRGRLDEALLRHAARAGAEVRRGQTILRAEPVGRGARLTLADGAVHAAGTLFLATGKHDLRGLRRAAAAEDLVGFKLHLALPPATLRALSGHVEIVLFPDAYAGLQRIEEERANLCLLVRRARLEAAGGTAESLLDDLMAANAHLRGRLAGAVPLLPRPLAIFRVPYGFVHAPAPDEAVFRLGDQAAVIPSFTGDGMAIALHSAALAARTFLAGGDAATYHRRLRREAGRPVGRAWALYRIGARPAGQAALMAAARLWPGALRLAAAATRVARRGDPGPAA
jgi:flavin-dependent dehydrogenase